MPSGAAPVRRLAAIMFTDIVGYTALMGESEERGLRARERHRALIRPLVEQHRGESIEARGDESLSLFSSALDAVRCALALQERLQQDPEPLRLHVGIHSSDVLVGGGEITGDGVNVASRICALSEGGGICVSGEVYQAVRNQPRIVARALGEQRLRNVSRPVSVFAIAAPGGLPAGRPRRGRVRWGLAAAAVVLALVAGGYALQRPLLRLAVLVLIALQRAPFEQEIQVTTTSDGVRIAFASVGRGPPVVFAPGWVTHLEHGLQSPLFDPFTPRLGDRFRVVRYDQRGTGVSQRRSADLSLEGRARDLEAVIEAVASPRVALVGTSAGGPPAILYAARHPERLTRLALVGTFASRTEEQRRSSRLLAEAAQTGWGRDHAVIRKLISLQLIPEADELTLQGLNELQRIAVAPDVAAFFLAEGGRIDVRDEARRIAVPTLVMHVVGDRTSPLESGRELAGLIPGARFLPLPGVNHLPVGEERRALLDALEGWLERDLARPEPRGPAR